MHPSMQGRTDSIDDTMNADHDRASGSDGGAARTLRVFRASCVPGADTPRPFYESLGFVFTGELDDDEEVLALRFI